MTDETTEPQSDRHGQTVIDGVPPPKLYEGLPVSETRGAIAGVSDLAWPPEIKLYDKVKVTLYGMVASDSHKVNDDGTVTLINTIKTDETTIEAA